MYVSRPSGPTSGLFHEHRTDTVMRIGEDVRVRRAQYKKYTNHYAPRNNFAANEWKLSDCCCYHCGHETLLAIGNISMNSARKMMLVCERLIAHHQDFGAPPRLTQITASTYLHQTNSTKPPWFIVA